MRVLLLQGAPVIGDVARNAALCIEGIRAAAAGGARILLGSELMLSGYPPRDLLERGDLLRACQVAAEDVARATAGTDVIAVFGTPWRDRGVRNSAVIAAGGEIVAVRHKTLLPTYDVFDEHRYFVPETDPRPVDVGGLRLGVTVCEDIWNEPGMGRRYDADPVERMRGTDVVLNLSSSPFHAAKGAVRLDLIRRKAALAGAPLVYCNQVGGNDELLFDGGSLAVAADGRLLFQGPQFRTGSWFVDLDGPGLVPTALPFEEEVLEALTMGVRDYAARCGFKTAVLGLSGGIDSALVAVVGARALGAENVFAVGMPGPFSSAGSIDDAKALADTLGLQWVQLPITPVYDRFLETLAPVFAGVKRDVTEENLQARVRGTLLMALSNKFGHLLLTTGNKSEMAVGYCTLYGDMNGGLAVLSDVFKTDVYRLARWINRDGEVIPAATIAKPPSAELAPNQTDQDSLPPYDQLDAILCLYVEGVVDPDDIVARGHPRDIVERVVRMVVRSEYKRWQAAPGLRVSPRAFGIGRRIPLAQVWR
ncbi:MAG: NAD+ synthase [Pseudomonadota bacterium]|nr:NAD+ synthase [Pseudomonadota bacterium]